MLGTTPAIVPAEFSIAVNRASPRGAIPLAIRACGLRGTPSLILIGRGGRIRLDHFGQVEDMVVSARIACLLAEPG